jgi:hypothetical protein
MRGAPIANIAPEAKSGVGRSGLKFSDIPQTGMCRRASFVAAARFFVLSAAPAPRGEERAYETEVLQFPFQRSRCAAVYLISTNPT